MPKPVTLADRVTAAAAALPLADIAAALATVVSKPSRPKQTIVRDAPPIGHPDSGFGEDGESRVSPMRFAPVGRLKRARLVHPRVGRSQAYTWTGKRADRRAGTWTQFMLVTIIAHSDTRYAIAAHHNSGEYAGKHLDFAWAAANGYITLA